MTVQDVIVILWMEPGNDDVLTCLLNTDRADLSECQSVEKLEDLRTGSQAACLPRECVAFEAAGIVCCVLCGAGDDDPSQS